MKKFTALLLTLIMVFTLVACGGNGDNPGGNTDNPGTSQSENKNNETGGNNNNNHNNNGDNPSGSISQAQMEAEILRRLSAISDLSALTLCGGDSISYTEDGIFWAGDYWIVENPSMSKEDFVSSVEAQLTAAGFVADYGILGTDYTVKAGTGEIGITIWYDSDSAELTLRMTNKREEYSKAFIEAENAKLPTIIEGIDIIDKLPENFSITFKTVTYQYTVCRYNGGYYVCGESLDQEGRDMIITSYDVAIPKGDGTYTFYDWYDTYYAYNDTFKEGKPQETTAFMNQGDETVEERMHNLMKELSTWIRMSWDYKALPVDEDRFIFGQTCRDYSISENMTKVGAETFLGRSCEKVHSEGLWADTYDIIYDLETGMVMQMIVWESGTGEAKTFVEVTEYNTNPTSLGNFVQP